MQNTIDLDFVPVSLTHRNDLLVSLVYQDGNESHGSICNEHKANYIIDAYMDAIDVYAVKVVDFYGKVDVHHTNSGMNQTYCLRNMDTDFEPENDDIQELNFNL